MPPPVPPVFDLIILLLILSCECSTLVPSISIPPPPPTAKLSLTKELVKVSDELLPL